MAWADEPVESAELADTDASAAPDDAVEVYDDADDLAELDASAAHIERISGDDRYDTAARIAAKFEGTGGTVIIATGENYPDALCASTLAGCYGAPILMASRDALPQCTAAQLERLQPSKAFIVGGAAAVGESVERALDAYCGEVVRLAGGDRFGTCARINEEVASASASAPSDTCVIATGAGFADALSISAWAYAAKAPIFLCADGEAPA